VSGLAGAGLDRMTRGEAPPFVVRQPSDRVFEMPSGAPLTRRRTGA